MAGIRHQEWSEALDREQTGRAMASNAWSDLRHRVYALDVFEAGNIMLSERCGAGCRQVHEATVRRVLDLPLFDYRAVLSAPRRGLLRNQCGFSRLDQVTGRTTKPSSDPERLQGG